MLMEKLKLYIISIMLIAFQSCKTEKVSDHYNTNSKLLPGADRLVTEYISIIKNKRLGIIANEASILSNGVQLIDTLVKIDGVNIKAIFSPEHGYRISSSGGETVSDTSVKGIPVYSLYGKERKPSAQKLKNIDLIVYDLQDTGTRYYTYISTLFYVIQAAGENDIPVLVLDRPDPIGGNKVEGPVLNPGMKSFVGIAAIPVIYGMTPGELAKLFAGEYTSVSVNPSVEIIKMKNWKRDSFFVDYELNWIAPSPNIPDVETALIYPATAFLEGTNISEGRGTDSPFKQVGAPFINSVNIINELELFPHPGLLIRPVTFIPKRIPGKSENPKFENRECNGISIILTSPEKVKPVDFGISLLFALHKLYPGKFKFHNEQFDRLTGDRSVREMLLKNSTPDEIVKSWQTGLEKFLQIRSKYLLY